ncbi:MAG: ROK family protein [Bacteroidales bacterium]|jgi:glucokinase|nr:ROK family protein [Bacteroidales bacterium]
MDYTNDSRTILSLDAGGTNFDFFAVRGGDLVTDKLRFPASVDTLDDMLKMIIRGFENVSQQSGERPAAISFCFPGPADYKSGIIGDLENLPLFRGGVPLKAMLENYFGIPVFINNDGDLFAYGEAIAGLLPEVNNALKESGSDRKYNNLLGVTFGTGFGGGFVGSGKLFTGDNSAGMEINRMRNKLYLQTSAEDSVTVRAIKRVYARETGLKMKEVPEPEEIFNIGMGTLKGEGDAARKAFGEMAEVAGDALANAVTLTDSLVVVGGGLSGAWPLFLQQMVDEMNRAYHEISGDELPRMEIYAYNLKNEACVRDFYEDTSSRIRVPFSDELVKYDPIKKIGVGVSKLGTSRAVAIGAYAYAINELSD